MKQNEQQEQVIIYPAPKRITINGARANRAYGLFDSETGTQVTGFKKGTEGQVEFAGLDPNRHYDVGAIEGMGDEKPQFAITYTQPMRDDTDTILKNSGNLPVVYPRPYTIKDNGNNSNNVFDMVDDKGETVGQVINLSQTGDKPKIKCIWSFKIKGDSKE